MADINICPATTEPATSMLFKKYPKNGVISHALAKWLKSTLKPAAIFVIGANMSSVGMTAVMSIHKKGKAVRKAPEKTTAPHILYMSMLFRSFNSYAGKIYV